MTMWWRNARIPLAGEAALAVGVALAFFAAVAGTLTISTRALPVLLLAMLCAGVVVGAAHAGADLYAVPLALAAVLAFDFFYLPPLRQFGFPDYANWGALALYLGVAVLVCTVSARTRRRVESLNSIQGGLLDEQAALRRVATLIAKESPPAEVFEAVAEEVGRLMSIEGTRIYRYECDDTATVIGGWKLPLALKVGDRVSLEGDSVAARVLQTKLPARRDNYADATGSLARILQEEGIRSAVGCPISVGGRLWGAMVAGTAQSEPLPVGAEFRIARFTELVATAISNAQARAEVRASRARIVGAADETRQRIERDLHDGIQQRLVSLMLELRSAQASLPAQLDGAERALSRVNDGLAGVFDELREISHGIHPAILSESGLAPALKALARRSAVPVELDVRTDDRLPERVEVAAYYFVSEALTNVVKHAQASVVQVEVEPTDGQLRLSIHDDGVGGADPGRGSGLIGLRDRVEALGGRLEITSPPGGGTSLRVTLPIDDEQRLAGGA